MPPPSKTNQFFRPRPPPSSSVPTSDPFEPLPPSTAPRPHQAPAPRVLAVDIPPNLLRPVAFRVFTKKHNLTLKSDALTALCSFIGRRCGAEWRNSGSGEKLLDEIARQWKRNEGAGKILVDGGDALKGIMHGLDVPAGREPALRKERSFDFGAGIPSSMLIAGEDTIDVDNTATADISEDEIDPKSYLKIVDSFEQPKWSYNPLKKQFERAPKPTLFPPPQAKTALFRNRYNTIYQRILRNESFLPPTYSKSHAEQKKYYKLTLISALLGRAGQSFLLFGMLAISPAGTPSLYDTSGEISLDLSLASAIPENSAWFCPGVLCLVDGVYEEDGHFTAFTVAQPPPERREGSAEVFGHVDFLGNNVTLDMSTATGSGGGTQGRAMRKVERALDNIRWVIAGDVNLDNPRILHSLRKLFENYHAEPPLLFILCGSFSSQPMFPASDGPGSVAYKQGFDALAGLLEDFPTIVQHSRFLFVPGDNDAWESTFSGGASTTLPKGRIADVFTNRIKRVLKSEAVFASNPCRVGYFTSEVVVFRDDVLGRFQRNSIPFKPKQEDQMEVDGGAAVPPIDSDDDEAVAGPSSTRKAPGGGDAEVDPDVITARKLVKTLLDQACLAPFPLAIRPVLWDFAHTLRLYPLPTALILCEPAAQPFTVTYEGCHVMNPGKMVDRRRMRWIEYSPAEKKGREMGQNI